MKLFKRSNGYWYIRFKRGKEKSLRTKDKRLAQRLYKEIQKEILKGKLIQLDRQSNITLKEFTEEYLKYSSSVKSYSTYKRDAFSLKKLLEFVGNIPLRSITVEKLEKYHAFLLDRGQKPGGVNVEIRHLKAAFNKAKLWGYIKSNPYDRIKFFKVQKQPPVFLKEEEIRAVLEEIKDKDFKDLIICYLETGCRREELLRLNKEDIDFKNGFLRIKGKGERTRLIPMTEMVKRILSRRVKESSRIFPAWHPDTVTHKWIKIMKKLGMSYRLHDLRHTTASYLAIQGIPLQFIQELLGHSDITTTQIYAHLRPEDMKAALSITSVIKSKKSGKRQTPYLKLIEK